MNELHNILNSDDIIKYINPNIFISCQQKQYYDISEIRIDVFNNTDEQKFNDQLELGFKKKNFRRKSKKKDETKYLIIEDE